MELERKPPSNQEKDEACLELLTKLKGRLYSDNVSIARRAAYNLSWLQEDGLDILKDGLFGNTRRATKTASAYGMRNMRGRMKKMALECLEQGLEHSNNHVRETCERALMLLEKKKTRGAAPGASAKRRKFRIKEVPAKAARKARPKRTSNKIPTKPNRLQTR